MSTCPARGTRIKAAAFDAAMPGSDTWLRTALRWVLVEGRTVREVFNELNRPRPTDPTLREVKRRLTGIDVGDTTIYLPTTYTAFVKRCQRLRKECVNFAGQPGQKEKHDEPRNY